MQNSSLGILLMLLSTTSANLAAVVQKRAVDAMPAFEKRGLVENILAVLRAPAWLLGGALGMGGVVLNMAALGLADITVIQPLNGFGLVVLAVASRFYLGEQLGRRTVAGMLAVMAGVVMLGLTAPPSRNPTSVSDVLDAYVTTQALLTFVAFAAAMVVGVAVARRPGRAAGISYAAMASACAVLSLTLAKGCFGLLAVQGFWATLFMWPPWVLGVVASVLGVVALMGQQLSFQKGRAIDVTAVFASGLVLFPLVTGHFVFGETPGAGFGVALLFIVGGVVVLSMRDTSAEPPRIDGTTGGQAPG